MATSKFELIFETSLLVGECIFYQHQCTMDPRPGFFEIYMIVTVCIHGSLTDETLMCFVRVSNCFLLYDSCNKNEANVGRLFLFLFFFINHINKYYLKNSDARLELEVFTNFH